MFPFLSQPPSKPLFQEQAENLLNRRRFIIGLSASAAAATILRGALTSARASALPLPNSPMTLNVIDVAGNLRLTQQSIETYRKGHSKLVDKTRFTQAKEFGEGSRDLIATTTGWDINPRVLGIVKFFSTPFLSQT